MSIDIQKLRELLARPVSQLERDRAVYSALPELLDEVEALRNKLDVLQRRTTRHSLAKDLGSAVDADAAIMARITAERDAALGEVEALRKQCHASVKAAATIAEYVSAEPVRNVRFPEGLGPLEDPMTAEYATYATGWNEFRKAVLAALKAAGIDVEQS